MTLELPTELTIARAAELKALLLSALERGEELALSGRTVIEVDAAGLQILCAARRSALARNVRLAFVTRAQSAVLSQAISAAGLGIGEDERWLVEEGDDA